MDEAIMKFILELANTLQANPEEIVKAAQQNPEALKNAVTKYQETLDIQQAAQAFSESLQQYAKHGAKLAYINKLNKKCPEGYELTYFKKGGKAGCGCTPKIETGGKTPKKVDLATKDSIAINKYNNQELMVNRPGTFKKNKKGEAIWVPDRTKAPYKNKKGGEISKGNCKKKFEKGGNISFMRRGGTPESEGGINFSSQNKNLKNVPLRQLRQRYSYIGPYRDLNRLYDFNDPRIPSIVTPTVAPEVIINGEWYKIPFRTNRKFIKTRRKRKIPILLFYDKQTEQNEDLTKTQTKKLSSKPKSISRKYEPVKLQPSFTSISGIPMGPAEGSVVSSAPISGVNVFDNSAEPGGINIPTQSPTFNRSDIRLIMREKGFSPYRYSGALRRALRMVLNGQASDADKMLVKEMGILNGTEAANYFKNGGSLKLWNYSK